MSAADFKDMDKQERATQDPAPVEDALQPVERKGGARKVKVDRRAKTLRVFSVGSTLLFIAIVLVFNILFQALLGPTLTWDFTPQATYSLGDVTGKIVEGLERPVRIVALFDRANWTAIYSQFLSSTYVANSGASVGEVPLLLDEYVKLGGGKVVVEYIDPAKVPDVVKQLDPDGVLGVKGASLGTYVVTDPETKKSKIVGLMDMYALTADQSSYSYTLTGMTAEEAFSGAIQYVAAASTPVVYFVSGHEESDYSEDYSQFTKILTYNNFETRSLDIRTVSEIPADAAMLAFLDPQIDISGTERDLIFAYLKRGGRMLLISGFNITEFAQMNDLLTNFSIRITTDRVREGSTQLRYGGDPYTFLANVPTSAVSTQSQLVLGGARRIEALQNTVEWVTVEEILTTSTSGIYEPRGDVDTPSPEGTQVLGIATENKGWMSGDVKSAKIIVLGSSTLISDSALTLLGSISQYNQLFIYYAMEWLTDASKNSLYIPTKGLPSYSLNAGNATSFLIAQVLVVALIPLGLLLAALLVFRRRRHL